MKINNLNKQIHILLIEDDQALETIIRRTIRTIKKDITVSWVTNLEDAELLLKKDFYDLAIVDYNLPGLSNGLTFIESKWKNYPATKFMIMSAMPVAEFLRVVEDKKDCPPFLPKPFSPQDLALSVQGILKRRLQI